MRRGPFIAQPGEAQLRQRIFELETALRAAHDEIADLKQCFGATDDVGRLQSIGLTPYQAQMVALLYKRQEATREQLLFACHQDRPDERYDSGYKLLQVHICHARRALAKHGVEIVPLTGRGYFMPPASKALLAQAMQAA